MAELKRDIRLPGAVLLGLGSIVGTGVFVSLGVAAGVAGPLVVPALLIAALVATFNGLSSAQLAAAHPKSGGTYEYGYRYLTPRLGFSAGWMFLFAKSASAATAALGFAGYVLSATGSNEGLQVPLALGAVGFVTLLVLLGIKRSSLANAVVVSVTLIALLFFVLAGAPLALERAGTNLAGLSPRGLEDTASLLHASALLFVAFTGYGRVATLAEEVSEPRRTIPRAVVLTLAVSCLLYLAVLVVGIGVASAEGFAAATREQAAPLEVIARAFAFPGASMVLAVGAVTAMLGVLLNLVLGLSRVLLAMGRRGDMPAGFARIWAKTGAPFVAELVVGAGIAGLALLGSVRLTWSFSAVTVLVYYALTNLAALRLDEEDRWTPRLVPVLGLVGCLSLAAFIELFVLLAGGAVLVVGLLWHEVAKRLGAPRD
jgi:basic amino acid/polyamine antiporter, APA family